MGWVTGVGLEVAYMTSTRFTFRAPVHASLTACRLEKYGSGKEKEKKKEGFDTYTVLHLPLLSD